MLEARQQRREARRSDRPSRDVTKSTIQAAKPRREYNSRRQHELRSNKEERKTVTRNNAPRDRRREFWRGAWPPPHRHLHCDRVPPPRGTGISHSILLEPSLTLSISTLIKSWSIFVELPPLLLLSHHLISPTSIAGQPRPLSDASVSYWLMRPT